MEKRRLGRGLDALLGAESASGNGTPVELPTTAIAVNPYQPRKNFDQDELSALAASVKSHGILQPLVVRQAGGSYELVAGERRLRAAREVGLATVPVRIVNFNDQETLEAALIENLQRTDLNPIEKAHGFAEYLGRYKMTHEQLAQRLGLARSTITNLVNLLDLPPEIQDAVRLGQISEAHAKVLRSIKDRAAQVAMLKQIIATGLSVKATELALRDMKGTHQEPDPPSLDGESSAPEKTAHVIGLEDELRQRYATGVEIRLKGADRGQIVLRFDSNDEFMRLIEMLRR